MFLALALGASAIPFRGSMADHDLRSATALAATQCGKDLPNGLGVNAQCVPHISNIEKLLNTGNDPALGTKQRVWTIKVPALEPRKGFTGVIDVSPLTQTNGPWRATIDRSNTVRESNENNNTLTYPQ